MRLRAMAIKVLRLRRKISLRSLIRRKMSKASASPDSLQLHEIMLRIELRCVVGIVSAGFVSMGVYARSRTTKGSCAFVSEIQSV